MTVGSDAEARRRIVEDLDRTFVVEAAAGTGKTTSLVRRVLAMVESGVDIAGLAVVTFTDKAAGELRLRLRAGLERRRLEVSSPEVFTRALARLEEAHVCTIHRFAGELLRSRPVEAGVDPQFAPLSPGESRALFDEAFGRWFEAALAQPSPALKRALARDNASVERLRGGAFRLVEHRHLDAPWARRPADPAARAKAMVPSLLGLAERSERARSTSDRLFVALRPVREVARRSARLELEADRLEAELVGLGRELKRAAGRWMGGGSYGDGVDRGQLVQELGELTASLEAFTVEANADLAVTLRDDLLGVVTLYDELKAKRGALDFDDLLLRARDVLRFDEVLLADLRRRLTHLFVDEFQDTDPVQASLLLLLASSDPAPTDAFATSITPGKLFVVGDPKQSIYRFRHADPATYDIVRDLVVRSGGEVLQLGQSFRSVPSIVSFVNAAFAPAMTGDERSQQAAYVPLHATREATSAEPAVMGLPIREPYGIKRLARGSVRKSLPDTIAAFIAWLIDESGRTVVDPASGEAVPIAPRHIAVLFRQFESYGESTTKPLSEGLNKRGIPHVVAGSSLLGGRDEAHALITTLAAVEHADDPLAVYAALRGLLFGLTDEMLFDWTRRFGVLRATQLPITPIPRALEGVLEALLLLAELHRRRNTRPASETLAELLRATRAQVGFALSPSAEQAFLQVASIEQVAAGHERAGGLSYAAFAESLASLDTERAGAFEEASDDDVGNVRVMTVHRAKGLEFPVVILGDPAEGVAREPDKYVDVGRGLGAVSLLGCAPWDLVDAHDVELARAAAEGARVAYVAATRAMDLLVIPVVGDDPTFPPDGWLSVLSKTFAPPAGVKRLPVGPDTISNRPLDVDRPHRSLSAGLHQSAGGEVYIVDPALLAKPARSAQGVSHVELVAKDAERTLIDEGQEAYDHFEQARAEAITKSTRVTRRMETVTKRAKALSVAPAPTRPITKETVTRAAGRPGGKRFGTLVHAVLATVPLDADSKTIEAVAASAGKLVGAQPGEPEAAAAAVVAALRHKVFDRARAGTWVQREVPVTLSLDAYEVADGIVDLAFEEGGTIVVVDYKTDDPSRLLAEQRAGYEAQVDLYARAIEASLGKPATGLLLFI